MKHSWTTSGALAVLGAGLGVMATVSVQSVSGTVVIPDGLGALLGGCAALLTAIVAIAGFTRWETRHRRERQAEVASEALVATFAFCAELRRVAGEEPPPEGNGPKAFYGHLHSIIRAARTAERFTEAQNKVAAYLPPGATDALQDLVGLAERVSIIVTVAFYSAGTDPSPMPEHEKEYKATIAKLPKDIDAKLSAVKGALQPFIWLT